MRRCDLILVRLILAGAALLGAGGCGWFGGPALQSGTYVGELSCRAIVTTSAGEREQEDYTLQATLIVASDGKLTVNQEPIESGQLVTRELPTATLGFEVTAINQGWRHVTVTYEPRPTLPGITITGDLMEDYQQAAGVIRAHGLANLVATDVSGDSTLQVDCSGALTRQ